MVYLCTDLIAALGAVVQTTRVGTAWSKISGLQAGVSVPGSGPGDRGFKSHPPHHCFSMNPQFSILVLFEESPYYDWRMGIIMGRLRTNDVVSIAKMLLPNSILNSGFTSLNRRSRSPLPAIASLDA